MVSIHKGTFSDALCLRYGWLPIGLPSKCVCGNGLIIDHAMKCSSSGFPTGENLQYTTVNFEDEVDFYISARKFWGHHHQSLGFFDARVFNPTAYTTIASLYRRFVQEKHATTL